MRGDILLTGERGQGKSFQFTPLREGRLNLYNRVKRGDVISIHAPA